MTAERWARITDLFRAALEKSVGDRAAFLENACGGDDGLRRDIERLLAGEAEPSLPSPLPEFLDGSALELAPDDMLAHYRVEAKSGQGGMGAVYRAYDTQLQRKVALKILPPESRADPERMGRLMREARAASALNHPNIVTIYEVGSDRGVDFIAMELVSGQTLARLIGRKGLPLKDALKYAIRIASALAAAHGAGIVHRDLKPANIMINEAGQVKVLDFGLAKRTERAADEETGSTLVMGPKTDTGAILGTVIYMSPEQAEGKKLDSRSDIFSFGAVLYEMVTGKRAFERDSTAATLAAILKEEPKPAGELATGLPPDLEKVLTRCLRKDPARRFQHMEDLEVAMEELKEDLESGPGITSLTAQDVSHPRRTARWAWISALAVLVLLVGTVGGLRLWRPRMEPTQPPPRIVPFTSYPGSESQPAFSPDGRQIAFVWDGQAGGNPHIYVKLIDSGTPLQLTTNAAHDCCPTWSPDGSRIAFIRTSAERGGIFVVSALGGPERKFAEAEATGIDWSPDGKFLAISEQNSPGEPFSLFLRSVDTGEKRRLTSAPSIAPFGDYYPAWSPDGSTLAFARSSKIAVSDIYLVPVAGGEPRRLTFDDRRIDGLAWTPDGSSIVFSSWRAEGPGLWKVSASSSPGSVTPERLATVGGNIASLSVSRQAHRLAYAESVLNTNIWRVDGPALKGGDHRPTKLIASTRQEGNPQYSPDGQRIAFRSDRSGSPEIWVCDSEGRNAIQLTSFGGPLTGAPRWSPDGRQIAFDSRPSGNVDIYIIGSEGGTPRRLTTGPSIEVMPSWSKDGRWIYFASNRGGDFQVWKLPSEGGSAVQVTKQGGSATQESKDGAFLYYAKSLYAPGLWRVPVGGGEEKPVIDGFPRESVNAWAMTDQGIYFIGLVKQNAGSRPSGKYVIHFFSFATGRMTPFAPLEREPESNAPAFAISSDARWILYSQIDQSGSDIMLVENFR